MRSEFAAIAAPILLLSAPVTAGDPKENGKTEPAAEQKKETKKAKKICRRISEGMGSRRKTRVCMTADEWRDFNQGR